MADTHPPPKLRRKPEGHSTCTGPLALLPPKGRLLGPDADTAGLRQLPLPCTEWDFISSLVRLLSFLSHSHSVSSSHIPRKGKAQKGSSPRSPLPEPALPLLGALLTNSAHYSPWHFMVGNLLAPQPWGGCPQLPFSGVKAEAQKV